MTYFSLTFAISWGGFVLVVGPGGFPGTASQFDTLLPFVASAMLVATLMYGSLTASTIFVFTPAATGASFLIYTSALAGAMWIVVAAVAFASCGQLSGRPLQRRMA